MAYDEGLAERIRAYLGPREGLREQKMFGGIGYMLRGNLACGVLKDALLVRAGPEGHDAAVALPHVEPMRMGGRESRGFVVVAPQAVASDAELARWIEVGVAFAASLPPK